MSLDEATLRNVVREELRAVFGETREEALVYTRKEAARALRVSLSQLYRLIAAGRLEALPSGIARAELERFTRTPQTKLRTNATRGKKVHRASVEAERVVEWLKTEKQRRRRGST